MSDLQPDPASFRDPAGHVYEVNGDIFRSITNYADSQFQDLQSSGLLDSLTEKGLLIRTENIPPENWPFQNNDIKHIISHPRLPYISYPYEWPFSLLKRAALLHLDLHLEILKNNFTLSDASAYNIQFQGAQPVFIDVLSLRPYQEGEFWGAHRQFCEHFICPLLLRSLFGIAHNSWFRGNMEGINIEEFAKLLKFRHKLSWNILTHIVLQTKFQTRAVGQTRAASEKLKTRKLPKNSYIGILQQLRGWINRLEPKYSEKTIWADYEETHSYNNEEEQAKHQFIAEFCEKTRPAQLWDLGCNTGEYSETALKSGAGYVIGFDFDQTALERAVQRADKNKLNFLPLFLDGANPSPNQGWQGRERKAFTHRGIPDALIALAFEHHLAIGRNIPLSQLVPWLVSIAPQGILEFVPKSDPTIQIMLALREDIFFDYNEQYFEALLLEHAEIIKTKTVSRSGRKMYWYQRY